MKRIALLMTSDFSYDQRMMKVHQLLSDHGSVDIMHKGKGYQSIKTFFTKGPMFYFEYNIKLYVRLMLSTYDVVYAVDTDTLSAAGVASFFKRFRLVYDSHEYFIGVPELENSLLKKYIWKTCERWFIPRSHLCLTVSDTLASILTDEFGKQFFSIKNVPVKSTLPRKYNLDKPYFIYQGAINEGRGLEELLDIMKYYPNYQLYLAGDGDIMKNIYAKINTGNFANVKLLGKLHPNELAIYTASASIGFNLLSKMSQSYYYSGANKCYDYINALVPSINMNFPEYSYIYRKFKVGAIVSNLEPNSLTFAINLLLDKISREVCIEECKLAREEYNWEVEKIKLKDLFVEYNIL